MVHELVRTNNAVLITAIEALLKGAEIPHMVLDQHMSVLEGSLGMLPRRIVVDEEDLAVARQLLEDAGLAHELRPGSGGSKPETTDDAVLGGRLRITQKKRGHRVEIVHRDPGCSTLDRTEKRVEFVFVTTDDRGDVLNVETPEDDLSSGGVNGSSREVVL